MAQKAFVYIVKCKDGSLYTGIAKDLKKGCGSITIRPERAQNIPEAAA